MNSAKAGFTRLYERRLTTYIMASLILAGAIIYVAFIWRFGDIAGTQLAELGNFVGGLFGAFSAVLIIATLYLQQDALQEQRRGQTFLNTFEALKFIGPDLEGLARRLAHATRLVVVGGKLEEYEERFKNGERNVYLVRIGTGIGQLRSFMERDLATLDTAAKKELVKAQIIVRRYCEVFSIVTDLIEDAEPGHRTSMTNSIMMTSYGRAYEILNVLRQSFKTTSSSPDGAAAEESVILPE